uniref:Glycosyltransferase 1 domain-containing protein 1-like n=1 Tax=Sinocyclocheilus anshuiensis TaxID=1608454 RepID=A0A671Q8Q5_9TELE
MEVQHVCIDLCHITFHCSETLKHLIQDQQFLYTCSRVFLQLLALLTLLTSIQCLNVTLLSCVLGVCTKKVGNLRVFLLVCGLRRVKDPLYLLEPFAEWHSQNPLVVLIIIGPKIDPVFTAEVEESVKRTVGVYLAADLSQEELHAAMQKSFALVNSSLSEGMSAAILEAMDLGLPVLARDVPGNAAIVEHEVTGLLYSSPQEFVSLSRKLLDDRGLQERLVRNGKNYITACHTPMKERITYQKLVETLY